jgi:pimeloyl-ACP methyl ester carboxylesterase
MQNLPGLEKNTLQLPGGEEIVYYSGGDPSGDAVLLLHGGGTDNAMLSWKGTLPALLQAGYRVFAPNYPGYGESPPARTPSTSTYLVGLVGALMDAWDLKQAALVGISMGGSIAIGCTLEQPRRVSQLVLVGTYGIQDKAPYHLMSLLMVRLPWLMDAAWGMARGSRWAARYSLKNILRSPEAVTEDLVDEVMVAMQNLAAQKAFAQWQRDEILWNSTKTNYTSRLAEISIPVLLVHGSHDIGVPVRYAQRAAALLPNAHLEVFENAGHWTQRDYPARFNRLLLSFLKEKTASA